MPASPVDAHGAESCSAAGMLVRATNTRSTLTGDNMQAKPWAGIGLTRLGRSLEATMGTTSGGGSWRISRPKAPNQTKVLSSHFSYRLVSQPEKGLLWYMLVRRGCRNMLRLARLIRVCHQKCLTPGPHFQELLPQGFHPINFTTALDSLCEPQDDGLLT